MFWCWAVMAIDFIRGILASLAKTVKASCPHPFLFAHFVLCFLFEGKFLKKMKFYQYYDKPWHQHTWVRVLLAVAALVVVLAAWFGWNVYQEVQYLRENPNRASLFGGQEGVEPMGIAEVRALVESHDDPSFGPPNAQAVIVEFSDFECPFCQSSFSAVDELREKYQGQVLWIYRDFPLATHPNAQKAAEAGECAHDQGLFWPMHDKLFESRDGLGNAALKRYASEAGLDMPTFASCLDSGQKAEEVREDITVGIAAGVQGTPTFYFNGFPWFGAIDTERMEAIIIKLLEQAEAN